MSRRTIELKKNRPIKTLRSTQRGYEKERDVTPYRPEVKLCLERAGFFTDVFKKTEGEPLTMRKAKALEMDGSSGAAYWGYSGLLGATPDGRKDKEPFNDGTISPVNQRDKEGPTAVLNSVCKVDPITTLNHLLNQKFLPQFLEGPNREIFADYLETWADMGIHHIQFNVADAQTLREAQKNPEKGADLVVRIAGYSAYFVDLTKGLQDSIIERVEQNLK